MKSRATIRTKSTDELPFGLCPAWRLLVECYYFRNRVHRSTHSLPILSASRTLREFAHVFLVITYRHARSNLLLLLVSALWPPAPFVCRQSVPQSDIIAYYFDIAQTKFSKCSAQSFTFARLRWTNDLDTLDIFNPRRCRHHHSEAPDKLLSWCRSRSPNMVLNFKAINSFNTAPSS